MEIKNNLFLLWNLDLFFLCNFSAFCKNCSLVGNLNLICKGSQTLYRVKRAGKFPKSSGKIDLTQAFSKKYLHHSLFRSGETPLRDNLQIYWEFMEDEEAEEEGRTGKEGFQVSSESEFYYEKMDYLVMNGDPFWLGGKLVLYIVEISSISSFFKVLLDVKF